MSRAAMDSVGIYEYSSKDLIGHGAFAVVYKGRVKMVSQALTHQPILSMSDSDSRVWNAMSFYCP